MSETKEYSKEDITVYWNANLCQHVAECVKGSPAVFNPKNKPWVNIDAEDADKIKATINKCPSGALSYKK